MTSRERVIAVIEHRKPDRIPNYGGLRANLEEQIFRVFGSVEAFEDRYEFDFAHLFGGPSPYGENKMDDLRAALGGPITPAALLDVPLSDPDEMAAYDAIRQGIEHHKIRRGRFVYVQTPGIFECLNNPFGIENHLLYLALYEDELQEVYRRQAEWNRRFAMNCLDLGVDMAHVSDDSGARHGAAVQSGHVAADDPPASPARGPGGQSARRLSQPAQRRQHRAAARWHRGTGLRHVPSLSGVRRHGP